MAEQIEACLDENAALGCKDSGVNRQQLLMETKRPGHVTGQVRLEQLLGHDTAEVSRGSHHPDGAD